MSFEQLDPHTQHYLQTVSARRGQAALDAWCQYVSAEDGHHKLSVARRIDCARRFAARWLAPSI